MLTTNQTNLTQLRDAVLKASDQICVCSAWIRSETIEQVFPPKIKSKIKAGEIKLRIIVRLGEEADIKITDYKVYNFISEMGAEFRYHRKLHAKLFLVDDTFAMLGSFNLTGGGFGDENNPGGNPEVGIVMKSKMEIKEAQSAFDFIWNEEAKPLKNNLFGFVLNPASHRDFNLASIRPVEVNRYLEVPIRSASEEDQFLLCKVVHAENYVENYFSKPSPESGGLSDNELYKAFSSTHDLAGRVRAIAMNKPHQWYVPVCTCLILAKVTVTPDRGLKVDLNLAPAPVGEEVFDADPKRLNQLYNKHDFAPAVMLSNRTIPVGFNPTELTTKHMAIFGSTGSGKSYFAKKFLSENLIDWYCKPKENKNAGRIIVLDPHGEYSRDFTKAGGEFPLLPDQVQVLGETTELKARYIQDADELSEICGLKSISKKQKEHIDKQIRKFRKSTTNEDSEFLELLIAENFSGDDIDFESTFASVKKAIRSALPQYLTNLYKIGKEIIDQELLDNPEYDEKGKIKSLGTTEKNIRYRDKTVELFNSLPETTRQDIERNIVEKNFKAVVQDYYQKEVAILDEWMIDSIHQEIQGQRITLVKTNLLEEMTDPKVYCLNLSGISDEEVRYALSANIMTEIFNRKREAPSEELDTLFVIEEAHNFAPEGAGRGNPASKIIQKIAAEGRKFNIGLMVITQRPAYVSKGVLSQCSTQAIFRLINSADIKAIAETVEGISEEELTQLPRFRMGEGIFTGVAVEEPVLVKVLPKE